MGRKKKEQGKTTSLEAVKIWVNSEGSEKGYLRKETGTEPGKSRAEAWRVTC